jgi:uroporphyrinogen III methyltransferase/synthase
MPEQAPLKGINVLVTRERSQAASLCRLLEAEGARAIVCPLIAFAPPSDWSAVDHSLSQLTAYDGVFFTSRNGVRFFTERMRDRGCPLESLKAIPCYAVGPTTAGALRSQGIEVRALPDRFQAEGLADLLDRQDLAGKRFLFPRAELGREILPMFIEKKGGQVDVVVVYETTEAQENAVLLKSILAKERLDYLTFTSPSTVKSFVEMAGRDQERKPWHDIPAACIGEITAKTAHSMGFKQVLTAKPSTVQALVRSIVVHEVTGRHENIRNNLES